ncbi:hypothetical protein WAX74_05370 [Psychrobacillus sp. FJAT-51614]|uniref:HTH HARE-type domain-containing protein n=1 Tax=Psychrobacillus mangrovi TaxID=3117745 RepID=A0ABU8F4A7_9BACI
MKNNKVSMMDAILIEILRSNGVSNNEILQQLERKDIQSWETDYPNNNFHSLFSLFEEDKNKFESILQEGYTVKFVTRNGLKNLLKLKYQKIDERDFELLENGIKHLEIDEQQLSSLKQLLSINWVIQEDTNKTYPKFVDIIPASTI